MEFKDRVHRKILSHQSKVEEWFLEKSHAVDFPIYCSVDIRDAGNKIASVDANVYPAGFNNICDVDQEHAGGLFKAYLSKHYGTADLNILLLAEEHTSNRYYWENINVLKTLLEKAGARVCVSVPKSFKGEFSVSTPKGASIVVHSAHRKNSFIELENGFRPELIVSNNDFSDPYTDWYQGLETPVNPSRELGWFRRKKSDHFKFYNKLAVEFSDLIQVDARAFTVQTELTRVDFGDPSSVEALAQATQKFIDSLCKGYKGSQPLDCQPTVFIKNNSGTYGMGILSVKSGEEILQLSSKERKKLDYAKGGRAVTEVIIQEGIPTSLASEGATAEPAIYMIGNRLAGGFLRAHGTKGPVENLNSPGAVYKRLCMNDLLVDVEGACLENVYGWVAQLNALAIGEEARVVGAVHSKK